MENLLMILRDLRDLKNLRLTLGVGFVTLCLRILTLIQMIHHQMKIFIKENWFLFKMKKIIFLIIFSFFFLHFVDASQVYLDSILSQEDLISLNQQISSLEENYGIKLKFIVEDTDQLAIGQSFLYFHILHLDEGEMKNWNLLVFYNIQRNELRFVTYKECSIGNKDLENIKNRNFVLNVLNSDNPSN